MAVRKRKKQPLGPAWLRLGMALGGSACMGLAIGTAMQWIAAGSLAEVWEWFVKWPTYLLLTGALYGGAVFVLGTLLGRLWLSAALTGAAGLLLALVDYFKTAINGTPLELADFGLAAQAGEVAGVAGELRPPTDFWMALIALALCVGILALVRRLTALAGRVRFLAGTAALAVMLGLLFSAQGAQAVGNLLGVDMNTRLAAANSRDTYGLTLSLWRTAFLQTKQAPEGYGPEYMEDVLARIDEILAEDGAAQADAGEQPNVIFVLSESFYDLTELPGLQYEQDPLENFHALQAEGISGEFHSHYLGYGTGYLEMSMLYGITGLDFGAGTNICFLEDGAYERFDSLAEQFTGDGCRAEMLHGYNDSLYNRTVTYPLLGFSDLLFSADIQELGIQDQVYGGYYMRDAYLFQGLLERMEAINSGGERAFLYAITMENHQPFDPEKFGGACQIGVTGPLDEADMAIVRVMLEGITRADQALGALTDALRQSGEPTVVVFFGDHRPNLFMTDGDTVYTKLGMCPDNDSSGWTAEELCTLYATDYLIWANDPALLAGQAGTERESSITAIGPQLLELLGQPVSRYWGLLEQVSRVCLTSTEQYFVDGAGVPWPSAEAADLTAQARELLKLREDVIYDAMYGRQYITAEMNQPAGT